MIIRLALTGFVIMAAFAAGYVMGGRQMHPAKVKLSCTPSAPQIIASSANTPTVLFWGNSLLHDHDWRFPSRTSINCAVQGLPASAAAPMVATLPEIGPSEVVIAFGSVELVRAGAKGAPVNENDFAQAVSQNIAALKNRWPQARLILSSAPSFDANTKIDPIEAQIVNAALARIADDDAKVSFFEMSKLYPSDDAQLPGKATYDGVHLTRDAYKLWQAALVRRLANP